MFFHKSQHEAKSHYHMLIFLQCNTESPQAFYITQKARRLIDRPWLTVDPPSQRLLLSLSALPSSPLLSLPASIARLRSPTRHGEQGCSEGAAQPEKWHHHAYCGSIRPFPSCPLCFFSTLFRHAEPYGITRRMKVGFCPRRVSWSFKVE